MLIKVCGMRQADNVNQLTELGVDMVGFIFYPGSSRYVSGIAPQTPSAVARVGVFVNETQETIEQVALRNHLSHLQLHGAESVEMCRRLGTKWRIIKAISISKVDDFAKASAYEGVCDILLFDTKSDQYGGSGQLFDWSLLEYYKGDTPFLLSGGISPQEVDSIKQIVHPKLLGIDLNSRFENEPAVKNIELLNQFIKNIRQ